MSRDPSILPRIRRLPPLLANQIAAGEVVERPASVVKELVENAIDAGATRISVEIRRGGSELIRVVDDGYGIHPDDLLLALDRHATSKILAAEDLAAIRSLGFRGEALPSIASVARLRLVSRIDSESMGRAVVSAPGAEDCQVQPAAHPVGTTVEVGGLFHTVPARRRFLRSEQTEALHVLDIARRLAMSRPNLGLRLVQDGRRVLDVPAGTEPSLRLREVLGRAMAQHSRAMDYHAGGMYLTGWLGDPAAHRSQTDHQYFFLNGRVVRDRQLGHAVRVAYADRVPGGRHPAYVLHLHMDAATTDVNVHPTKHEVRFRHARDVHDFITASLRDALGGGPASGAVAEAAGPWQAPSAPAMLLQQPAWRRRADFVPGVAAVPQAFLVAGRYLAREQDGDLWLADGLEICRRWFVARMAQEQGGGTVRSRPLLVPVKVTVTSAQADRIDGRRDIIGQLGLVLERTGPEEISVRGFPVFLSAWPVTGVVLALAHANDVDTGSLPAAMVRAFRADFPGQLGNGAALLELARELGGDSPWRRVDAAELARLLDAPGAHD